MVALRRVWLVLVLGILATAAMACSRSPGKVSLVNNDPSAGQNGGVSAPAKTDGSSPAQTAGDGSKAAPSSTGTRGTTACKDCQSSNDAVKLSDADGFEFETGEAEAGRIQAGQPGKGDEKAVTFDAGRGMTGTTGSSNLTPR
jgi:hypothetical protein